MKKSHRQGWVAVGAFFLVTLFLSLYVNTVITKNDVIADIKDNPLKYGLTLAEPTPSHTPQTGWDALTYSEQRKVRERIRVEVEEEVKRENHLGDFISVPNSKLYVQLDSYHGFPVRYYYYYHPRCPVIGYPSYTTANLYRAFYKIDGEQNSDVEDEFRFHNNKARITFVMLEYEVFKELHTPFSGIYMVAVSLRFPLGSLEADILYCVWDKKNQCPIPFEYPSEALKYLKGERQSPSGQRED